MTNVNKSEIFPVFLQRLVFAIYADLLQNLFRRDLHTFGWRKIKLKFLYVEKNDKYELFQCNHSWGLWPTYEVPFQYLYWVQVLSYSVCPAFMICNIFGDKKRNYLEHRRVDKRTKFWAIDCNTSNLFMLFSTYNYGWSKRLLEELKKSFCPLGPSLDIEIYSEPYRLAEGWS